MSQHDTTVRLRHMLDYAKEALEITRGVSRDDLHENRLLSLALTRLLEILGEAAAKVPPEDRNAMSGLPWRDIIDLRNRLIHGYDTVNLDILWVIVDQDLPPLVSELTRIVESR